MRKSKYNSKGNIKITYFFGAGASYHSVPIWDMQAKSMKTVAKRLESLINDLKYIETTEKKYKVLIDNEVIKEIIFYLKKYSDKAEEFGTLDIYAKNLFLLGDDRELNRLKYHLSVYFDIWEHFIGNQIILDNDIRYSKIDKRYYSLLSVILEKGIHNPVINKDVSFISWNYDLQLEMAYKSFMSNPENETLDSLNEEFPFYLKEIKKKNIHLNGFRGVFNHEGKIYSNVAKENWKSIEDYLKGIIKNAEDFKRRSSIDYQNNIKYAWEENSKSIKEASEVMKNTDVLIIIGYSFPSYNRKVDSELLKAFELSEKGNKKRIIYQNIEDNTEIIKSITSIEPEFYSNVSQFNIPQEFLFPEEDQDIVLGA